MITIIHGSNQVVCRNELNLHKAKFKEVVTLDGKNLILKDLELTISSQSLFGLERLVVIENFFAGKKNREDIITFLNSSNINYELVFWEEKESKSKDLTKFSPSNTKILLYNLPSIIFKFLDSVYPGNLKQVLALFAQVLEANEAEIIFFMLVKQFRYLLLSRLEAKIFPSDYSRLAPWQKQKIAGQSTHFTKDQLLDMYSHMLQLEYSLKSGQTSLEAAESLKLFLIQNL